MNYGKRLFDFAYDQLHTGPLDVMMKSKLGEQWKTWSTKEFIEQVNLASRGLMALGVEPGDRVALITHANRTEWNILDHAILQIGAVDVPIYPTMTEQDYEYILNHSESKLCFVSNKELSDKVSAIRSKVSSLQNVFTFEQVQGANHWSQLFEMGSHILQSEVDARKSSVKEEELATIIYTSGTTGLPKGVMLSHRNIASNVIDCEERLPLLDRGHSHALSFLPCCHIFERMLQYLYINNDVSFTLTGMESVKDDLALAQPHIFTGVPRLFEKFYDGIVAKGMANRGIKKTLFSWAHDLAIQWNPDRENGWWYEFKLGIARKLVFSKVKNALGLTGIRAVCSGSAALQPRLARFFSGAGIWLKEGYGLTETSPVITVNTLRTPGMWRAGTVGKVIKNVTVRIAEDGEILCKGPNVMLGYYKDKEKTDEVLKDGWFHTGDIGELRDGFLAITDRKKEMFKTSGGKYISPQLIENALKESLYIEQCMVIGDGQKFPAALIIPDYVQLRKWAGSNKVSFTADEDLAKNKQAGELIEKEIEKINSRFGAWERIKAFRLLPKLFSIDAGEITPTLKLKRKGVLSNNKLLVEEIYK
ncbi:MAG: long-chain fatty acid--CoA ligase [Flavobacteriales bacterium]|nr:long-chain fatty acid--CoA ligase [Flavobacteriales bacterium]